MTGQRPTGKADRIAGILGLGSDGQDGHIRITRGANFSVLLGSEATHQEMQDACMKIEARLRRDGRTITDLTKAEFVQLLEDLGKQTDA
ncbi:MAG: hypothetical protein KJ626_09720 [Verrucomicrobia bacterium]|nr:hypothetical protein [Verrucomicrobiota bacterium]